MNDVLTENQIRELPTVNLLELDVEYSRRAIVLGQPGRVCRTHKVIRRVLAARQP
jgi:hypothetical protein